MVDRRDSVDPADCLASRLTAPIPAGIATLAVRGRAAIDRALPLLGLRTQAPTIGRIYFGSVSLAELPHQSGDANVQQEHIVACLTSATSLEIHCHGGKAVSQRILDLVGSTGATIVAPDNFSQQTHSAVQHDARSALIAARTNRAASYWLHQLDGALERSVRAAIGSLESGRIEAAQRVLLEIERHADFAQRLASGWDIVIAGPPNVGKSSLLNALVGQERSIVNPEAGTTRDWVEAGTAIDGWPVRLSDTAGLRADADGAIESEGIELARKRVRDADLVLVVVDIQVGWTDVHQAICDACQGEMICLANKSDRLPDKLRQPHLDELQSACAPLSPILCSCVASSGLQLAMAAIASFINQQVPPDDSPLVFSAQLRSQFRQAIDQINAGKIDQATAMLSQTLVPPFASCSSGELPRK